MMNRAILLLVALAVAAAAPAGAWPPRTYEPDFGCVARGSSVAGECLIALTSGTYEIDVLMPHGREASFHLQIATETGWYVADCSYRSSLLEQSAGCDASAQQGTLFVHRSGGSSGQQLVEHFVDVTLTAPGWVSLRATGGSGVPTLRGRHSG